MFNSQSALPPRLKPAAYFVETAHDLEVSRLFHDAWHLVGSTHGLSQCGRFQTTEILGHPILCWHRDGEIHSFLNVCVHRSAPLATEPSGQMEMLRCQAHGWQYGKDGRGRRIDDTSGGIPSETDRPRLTKLATDTCGGLVFVSLSEQPPPLQDWLGVEGHARCLDLFGGERLNNLSLDLVVQGNWKLAVENALESYHVDTVHANTFGHAPPAESCTHRMYENGTAFATVEPPPASAGQRFELLMHRLIGFEHRELFEHAIYYPNVMVGRTKIYAWVMTSTPMSATTSRLRYLMFSRVPPGRRPVAWAALHLMNQAAGAYARRVIMEDVAIMPAVQRGLSSASRPPAGLISRREERVFHFQDHVATRCAPTP